MTPRGVLATTLALVSVAAAGGCAPDGGPAARGGGRTTLTVLAAASLTEVFEALGGDFSAAGDGGTTVRFSFGPSSGLVPQVLEGAPVDAVATASRAAMQPLQRERAVEPPVAFARNRLALVVPAGNPGRVRGLADLERTGLRVALCAPQVPCGSAAAQVLATAGVAARPDTLEPDVKAVLSRVVLGEVDAALVYRTDARAAGAAVEVVAAPEAEAVSTDYLVAAVVGSEHPDEARRFVRFLRSPVAAAALAAAGFEPVA